MSAIPQASIIIPAYNEEKGLPVVLEQLRKTLNTREISPDDSLADGTEVIIIDDGSSDKTAEIARGYSCKLISHQKNMGKGKAIQTGIANSRGEKIIFIDADGTYPVEEVLHIITRLDDNDVVFTAREWKNIPILNLIGNKMISAVIKVFSGFTGHDPLSGLYGIRRSVIEKLDVETSDFSIETEIVVKSTVMGFNMTELPIRYNRRLGESKINPFKDGLKILKLIFSLLVVYNPLMTFILPGIFLCLIGFIILLLTWAGPFHLSRNITLDTHTFIFSVMAILVGSQVIIQGVILDLYAVKHRYKKPGLALAIFKPLFFRGLFLLGLIILTVGIIITIKAAFIWIDNGFQPYFDTRRAVIALLLNLFGVQLIFSSLIGSVFVREIKNDKTSSG